MTNINPFLVAIMMVALASNAWCQQAGGDTVVPPESEPAPVWTPGIPLYDRNGVLVQADLKIATALMSVQNVGFGAGTTPRGAGNTIRDAQWAEGYVKPGVSGEADLGTQLGAFGTLYGGVMAITAGTVGDGDAGAIPSAGALGTQFTRGNTAHTDLERLYVGWRSGDATSARTSSGVDVSAGRQEFMIGDGFLIGDGNNDSDQDAGYYLGGRMAFSNSAIVRAAWMPLRTDVFALRSDKQTGTTELHGVNVEAVESGLGTVGGALMRVTSTNAAVAPAARDGMRVLDLRAQGTPVPGVPDLFLSAEYANEFNGNQTKALRADAWYGEAGYTFSSLPWTPTLSYRYSHFSGDNVATSRSEAFDPLFYAAGRGWGTWFQGEIAGQYMFFNSNENAHQFHLKAKPLSTLGVGVIGYVFYYDQKGSVAKATGGQGVSSDHFGNEINIYADWAPKDWLAISFVYGHLEVGDGGKEAYGSSQSMNLFELLTTMTF